jgi:hypothetical protein
VDSAALESYACSACGVTDENQQSDIMVAVSCCFAHDLDRTNSFARVLALGTRRKLELSDWAWIRLEARQVILAAFSHNYWGHSHRVRLVRVAVAQTLDD